MYFQHLPAIDGHVSTGLHNSMYEFSFYLLTFFSIVSTVQLNKGITELKLIMCYTIKKH